MGRRHPAAAAFLDRNADGNKHSAGLVARLLLAGLYAAECKQRGHRPLGERDEPCNDQWHKLPRQRSKVRKCCIFPTPKVMPCHNRLDRI